MVEPRQGEPRGSTGNIPVPSSKKWDAIIRLRFQIAVAEGLRIGGSGGGLEIGGVDANLMALRNPANNEPYIPGSSLKGKLRSVLEKELGKALGGDPCKCGSADCLICTVFGAHMKPGAASAPTRIVVRDALLSGQSRTRFQEAVLAGVPVLEEKTENIIDRKAGTARSPRTGERVLPGTVFDGEIILHIYEGDDADEMTKFIRHGLGIIQEACSLGASGSRGYGKVRFENLQVETLKLDQLTI